MRHFLFISLIIALAVPPLFGNVIVKRQAADEESETPFSNDGFLEEGPFNSPQELINTVGGLVRGVFDAFRRVAGTARDVAEPIMETLDLLGEAQARNPIVSTLAEGQRRIDEDFREEAPKVAEIGAPLRAIMQTALCDFLCPTIGGQLLSLPCQIHDCPQVGNKKEDTLRGLKDNLPNDDNDEDKDGGNGSSASNDQERTVVDAEDDADDASDIGAEFLGTLEEAASATQDDEDV